MYQQNRNAVFCIGFHFGLHPLWPVPPPDLVAFISQALASLQELWLMGNLLKQLPDGIEGLQVRAEGEEREEKGGQRWPEGSRGRGCD